MEAILHRSPRSRLRGGRNCNLKGHVAFRGVAGERRRRLGSRGLAVAVRCVPRTARPRLLGGILAPVPALPSLCGTDNAVGGLARPGWVGCACARRQSCVLCRELDVRSVLQGRGSHFNSLNVNMAHSDLLALRWGWEDFNCLARLPGRYF